MRPLHRGARHTTFYRYRRAGRARLPPCRLKPTKTIPTPRKRVHLRTPTAPRGPRCAWRWRACSRSLGGWSPATRGPTSSPSRPEARRRGTSCWCRSWRCGWRRCGWRRCGWRRCGGANWPGAAPRGRGRGRSACSGALRCFWSATSSVFRASGTSARWCCAWAACSPRRVSRWCERRGRRSCCWACSCPCRASCGRRSPSRCRTGPPRRPRSPRRSSAWTSPAGATSW